MEQNGKRYSEVALHQLFQTIFKYRRSFVMKVLELLINLKMHGVALEGRKHYVVQFKKVLCTVHL